MMRMIVPTDILESPYPRSVAIADWLATSDATPQPAPLALLRRRHPRALVPFVSVTSGALQCFLGGVHHQIALAVLLRYADGVEGHRHVLFADAKEPTDPQYDGSNLATLFKQHVPNVTDLAVVRIVDILLVVLTNWEGIAGHRCHELTALLSGYGRGRYGSTRQEKGDSGRGCKRPHFISPCG